MTVLENGFDGNGSECGMARGITRRAGMKGESTCRSYEEES